MTILGVNPSDIPFAHLYLIDDDGRIARLAAMVGFAGEGAATPEVLELNSPEAVWPLGKVFDTGSPELVVDLPKRFGTLPGGTWPELRIPTKLSAVSDLIVNADSISS